MQDSFVGVVDIYFSFADVLGSRVIKDTKLLLNTFLYLLLSNISHLHLPH